MAGKIARSVAAVLTVAVLASGASITGVLLEAQPALAASTQPEIDAAIAQILRETNAERAKAGLNPLVLTPKINAVAQSWSEQMAAKKSMTHNPGYSSGIPQPWLRAGENVGHGYTTSTIVGAWMASEGHRNNILGDFTHIGLGYWVDATGRAWFTQNFAKYVIPDPTMINDPVTTVGKVDFTSTWPLKWWEPKYDYYVELHSPDGSLLQTQTVTQPTVSFTGLAGDTTYTVEITARAVDPPGQTYLSPVKSYSITTLKDWPDITPPAVTFRDADGTEDDTFTIPAVVGVDYLVNGTITPPGTYPGKDSVTATVKAQPGYVLTQDADTTWSATFKVTPYTAIPAAVTF
ncbi:CAP domain-containing protein [Arthrobacter sp. K5]|uniref:CAP domain-containing protein n=1 Tax=Arthrobacter sp. K5 TaxID=2839623 RepID=A0AAU8EWJ6_9MICC